MKLFRVYCGCFFLLAAATMLGQNASNTSSTSGTSSVADELKKLREAVAEQQQQIAHQQEQIQNLQQQLDVQNVSATTNTGTPRLMDAALHTTTPNPAGDAPPQDAKPKESPLSFRIGGAEFTPGGFVDFESIFRSTNTGNVTATSFGAIPFSNTTAGQLTEFRSTGQYSRFNFKVSSKFGKNDINAYLEFDFNGNDATNVFAVSNPHTNRIRLYWVDVKRDKWEFLGGQTWGLQTPNRVGVSPMPSDLSLGYHEDSGIGVGYNYTRAAEFRVAYHFNKDWAWAVSLQNPQQWVGAGNVVFPSAFSAALTGQFDANNLTGTPNVGPDVMTKLAYDHDFSSRHLHWEVGGLETTVKATVKPTDATTFSSHSTVGGGVFGDVVADLYKGSQGRNVRFVANAMWGYGVGRYLNTLAPQAVVVPVETAPGIFDIRTSMVHSGDMVVGLEFLPHPKSQLGVYYGGVYAQRNAFQDVTSTAAIQPIIGFGGPGSANSANRAIQQGTVDWTQTFWRSPQYGALVLVNQFSYVTRAPWFVAAGSPKNAHLFMGYVSLRYVLP